ncbi:hypothetical protein NDU88_005833 [Pleurodeles waltl]|uniref:Uncharacterized protein n=1 Tax=Pleurodeles waltl TaxID=8319 RepID=A0AAV7SMZ8_PLEWA|nr:hypothetical protein NDU88_005833 [Pleurodeles waltl]
MVMEVVDEDVVHAGVSVDTTGREVDDKEEGDTVDEVDFGGSLCFSPKKVCQIIIACCITLALRRQVPFLQEDKAGDGHVEVVEPMNSDEEEADEEDVENRTTIIQQYFQ